MMARVIGILSGKGGVGKTTLVANIGTALSQDFGRDVVVLDANANSPHLGLHMGSYEELPREFGEYAPEVSEKNARARKNLFAATPQPGKLRGAIKKLSQEHEFVIVDFPPGLGREVVTAANAIDAGLVVTTPDFPALVAALKTMFLLEKMNKKVLGLVVNKRRGDKHELTLKEIESACARKVVAVVPEDKKVSEGIARGLPVVMLSPQSDSSMALKEFAGKLVGQEYKSKKFLDFVRKIFLRAV